MSPRVPAPPVRVSRPRARDATDARDRRRARAAGARRSRAADVPPRRLLPASRRPQRVSQRRPETRDAPVASIPMAIVAWTVFAAVLGDGARPGFAGLLLGYLVYDTTHFLMHDYSMPTRFGKFLKRHHMRHHFKRIDRDYGVSSPLWDVVFRTFSGDRRRAEAPAARP
ncbi:MAG: sterol desaturase family protein [Gemmatimonadota bacterium]